MVTLKLAMITTIIGSSILPIHTENMRTPMTYPTAQVEIINKKVVPAVPIENKIENIHAPMTYLTARVEIINKEQVEIVNKEIVPAAPIEKKEASYSINQDKTYEQCMKEAFERIYDEVNGLLDQIPDQTDEQFQLQRMM